MLYHTNVQATTGGATPSTLWVLAQDFCECNGERQASDALCSGDCCSPNCVNGACIGTPRTCGGCLGSAAINIATIGLLFPRGVLFVRRFRFFFFSL